MDPFSRVEAELIRLASGFHQDADTWYWRQSHQVIVWLRPCLSGARRDSRSEGLLTMDSYS